MPTARRARVAGAAAIVGGGLSAVLAGWVVLATYLEFFVLVHMLTPGSCGHQSPCIGEVTPITQFLFQIASLAASSLFQTVENIVLFVLQPLLVLGLVFVLAARMRGRLPRLVRVGLALVVGATLVFVVTGAAQVWVFVPLEHARLQMGDSPALAWFVPDLVAYQISVLTMAIGLLLLGVAALRARPLPFGNYLLIPLAVFVFVEFALVGGLLVLPESFGLEVLSGQAVMIVNAMGEWFYLIVQISGTLGEVVWVLLGVSLYRSAGQPARVPVVPALSGR